MNTSEQNAMLERLLKKHGLAYVKHVVEYKTTLRALAFARELLLAVQERDDNLPAKIESRLNTFTHNASYRAGWRAACEELRNQMQAQTYADLFPLESTEKEAHD